MPTRKLRAAGKTEVGKGLGFRRFKPCYRTSDSNETVKRIINVNGIGLCAIIYLVIRIDRELSNQAAFQSP